ncbi:MAG: MBL fold metallo-hydrolase, partial [Burkholderiales bacterium 12-64-5]
MPIPLEDLFNDVIAKSMRGLGISDAALAEKSGASVEDIAAAKAGKVDDRVLRKIAPHLQLDGLSLVAMAHAEWRPVQFNVTGL